MMTWVDVRDYGAKGDGTTDDTASFEAADAAAGQRSVLVSAGTYRLAGNVTFESDVRFEGTVVMAPETRLACTRNFDLNTYAAAFGGEEAGFRKAIQALFFFTDHVELDLSGRRVALSAPVEVQALAGLGSFHQRRIIRNGQLEAVANAAWNTTTVTSVSTYAVSQPTRLTAVANVANIPVGARVSGTGVGREVYVRSVNVAGATVELSQPLFAAAGTRTFTFQRYRYLIDLSGFENLSRIEFREIEFDCGGISSGLMLSKIGLALRVDNCVFNRPRDRGITSIGTGCQGLMIDTCQFQSNELDIPSQDRTTIAINVNANDTKIRGNRIVRFATFAILAGTGHLFVGNHFFQGDDTTAGTRRAGVVLTSPNVKTLFTGNYIDNSFIEWTNEYDPEPAFSSGFSFGGLTITGNIFTVNDVASHFRWLVITPRGPGHYIHGLSVVGNVFRTLNGNIDRVERIDDSFALMDTGRYRVIDFSQNVFHGISQITVSPVILQHDQTSVSDTWIVEAGPFMPFDARARNVTSLVAEGAITNASNVTQFAMPNVLTERGTGQTQVQVRWPTAVRGRIITTIRGDNPT